MTGFLEFDTGLTSADWASVPVDRAAASRSVAAPVTLMADAEIRDGIAALLALPVPKNISSLAWETLCADLRSFANDWLVEAIELGWTVPELFGYPSDLNAHRFNLIGLVPGLAGRPVEAINGNTATIRNRVGPPNVFYRHAPGCARPFDRSKAIPVWIAYAKEMAQ